MRDRLNAFIDALDAGEGRFARPEPPPVLR